MRRERWTEARHRATDAAGLFQAVLCLAKTPLRSPSVPSVADAARPALPSPLATPLPSPSGLKHYRAMAAIFLCLLGALRSALRRRSDLILENLALRHQLATFKNQHPRPRLSHPGRLFWVSLSQFWSRWREVLVVVKPETVVGWHRWAFRRFWAWRSRHRRLGRPPFGREVRDLVKRMATANEGWGAPRIHGELLKLGIVISEREVERFRRDDRAEAASSPGGSGGAWNLDVPGNDLGAATDDLFAKAMVIGQACPRQGLRRWCHRASISHRPSKTSMIFSMLLLRTLQFGMSAFTAGKHKRVRRPRREERLSAESLISSRS